jgi:ankyrin repeat protein
MAVLKLMAMTKLKAGIIGAAAVLGVATPFVIQHSNKLHEENVSLQKKLEGMTRLHTEISRLSNQVAQAETTQALTRDQVSELMKLRSEAGFLRQQTNQLAVLQEQLRKTANGQIPVTANQSSNQTRQMAEHPMLGYTYNFARSGNLDGLKKMLDQNPDILNLPVGNAGSTMLHTAAYNRQPEAVEELLRRGANVNAQNKEGHTPLYDCVLQGTKETLLLLLQAKADLSIPDAQGITPLKVAIDGGRTEFAAVLKEWGARE